MNPSSSCKVLFSLKKDTFCIWLKRSFSEKYTKITPLKTDLFLLMKTHFLFHLSDYSFKCSFEKKNSFEITLYFHFYCHCPNPCSYYLKFKLIVYPPLRPSTSCLLSFLIHSVHLCLNSFSESGIKKFRLWGQKDLSLNLAFPTYLLYDLRKAN